MAAPAPRLLPSKQPHLPDQRTPEQRYWRSFKTPVIIKESGSITHTHFSPSQAPHNLAISSSVRVQIYNPSSRQLLQSIHRFKDTVLCAEFRDDGKLLVASDKSGAIQVFELASRAILQHWNPADAHNHLQVSKVKWQGRTNVISAGDDRTVKLWDVTSKTPLRTFTGHQDYVRALSTVPDTNLILSGSLDGTAKLWDPRAETEVATFQHGEHTSGIVYSVLPMQGGTMFLTAGGSGIKVWDMTAGTEYPIKEMWNHQKEVTALCANNDGSRILAGGLDGHIKIYDVSNWKVTHGIKYPAAILTVSLSPDQKHLAVGMSSSLLSLRSRTSVQTKTTALPMKRSGIDTFPDYQSITPGDEPEYIYREKKQKSLREYDRALLGFRFGDALDLVLKQNDSILIKTILTELKHRSALTQALHNRTPETLMPILKWIEKNISDPRYTPIIIDVMYQILDIYGADLLDDNTVGHGLELITRKLEKELEKANTSQTLIGLLDLISK